MMMVGFDQGTETPFNNIDMTGSRDAAVAFRQCATAVDARVAKQGTAPQPFGQPTGKKDQARVKDNGSI